MKRNLLATLAFASFTGSMLAQLPVGTAPTNKKAVIEEFTGIHCGYCPDGHRIGTQIYTADPNNVVLINIHSGSFANSAVGEPDFKTTEGTAIDGMSGMGITGYPAGDVNREVLVGSVMAAGRGSWASMASTIKAQPAYCNVALQGTINATTRVLTVQVEVYYTANSPVGTNSLNVFLLEDYITGYQSNYGTPLYNIANYNPDGTYNHNHVLRKAITPTFGMTIPTTTMGTLFTTTLTYTIPTTYGATGKTTECMLGNLKLVAFVTESDRKTINADDGPITINNFANAIDVASTNLSADAAVCAGILTPTMKFKNLGSSPVTSAVFSYAMNGGAASNYTYTGAAVNPMSISNTFTLPTLNFTPLTTNSLVINVVSVNGSTDQNLANNIVSKSISNNTLIANSTNMQMDFTQDQYGSESKWTVYDEVTNAVIATEGPYTNLAASGTSLHTKSFTVTQATCYKLVVTDAYGDGINSGYGVGGYVLRAGGLPIITSNGQYGTGETKLYKTYTSINVGINEAGSVFNQISMFPNPSNGVTKIALELQQNNTVSVKVYNQIGQLVFETPAKELNAGTTEIEMNTAEWSAGLYNVVVKADNGSVTKKLTVSK